LLSEAKAQFGPAVPSIDAVLTRSRAHSGEGPRPDAFSTWSALSIDLAQDVGAHSDVHLLMLGLPPDFGRDFGWRLGSLINMLQKLSEQIGYCYQSASECNTKAADAVNEAASHEYYELERRWLTLARSYELSEHITDFSGELERRGKIAASLLGWHAISRAPFHRDLELAVLDTDGPHALVFPCRRILHGWVKAETRKTIDVRPTHWREWASEN
jgi:hypothetical protein